MKFYILTQINEPDYDESAAMVVLATSPKSARVSANAQAGDEGLIWTNPLKVRCKELRAEREAPGVILRDFNAG